MCLRHQTGVGHNESVTEAIWPARDDKMLQEDAFEDLVSFNGNTRFFIPPFRKKK
jgi:hypothetical protein